jgi:hypothetical protein
MPQVESAGDGLRVRRRVLIGVAVVLIAVAVIVVAACGRDTPHTPLPATTAASLQSPGPQCLPTVIESGYTNVGGRISVGMIAENPCPQAVINTVITVRAEDGDGTAIDSNGDDPPTMPVLLPGQRLGAGGTISVAKSAKVARVVVAFTRAEAVPVEAFAAWPKTVTVDELTHSTPDDRGFVVVSGKIRTDPSGATLCEPQVNLIVRNTTGKIIYGEVGTPDGIGATFESVFPAGSDFDRSEIYVAQGRPAVSLRPAAFASCSID